MVLHFMLAFICLMRVLHMDQSMFVHVAFKHGADVLCIIWMKVMLQNLRIENVLHFCRQSIILNHDGTEWICRTAV